MILNQTFLFLNLQLYIKAEGFLHTMTTYLDSPTRVEDILKQFKINEKSINPAHFEIIARVQEKAVLCLHLNRTSLVKAFKCKSENLWQLGHFRYLFIFISSI